MPSSSLAARDAPWNARAVVSHPPPAAAGAMIESWRVGYGLDASSPPDAPPGATIATTAATANTAPITAREPSPAHRSQVPTNGPRNYPCPPCPGLSSSLPPALPCCSPRAVDRTSPRPPSDRHTRGGHRHRDRGARRQPAARPRRTPASRRASKLAKPDETLDAARTYVATVKTNCGTFEITLDAERAPKTGGSFKFLADQGFYDGLLIHRIVPGFVFQGGDPWAPATGGPGYPSSRRRRRTSSTTSTSSRWRRPRRTTRGRVRARSSSSSPARTASS